MSRWQYDNDRAQLNETIRSCWLSSEYQLYADNQQIFLEETELFRKGYPLYIYFQPGKLEDGSILLTLKFFSWDTKLPKKTVITDAIYKQIYLTLLNH